MKTKLTFVFLFLAALSCNLSPSESKPDEGEQLERSPTIELPSSLNRKQLSPFNIDYETPFSEVQPVVWTSEGYAGVDYALPLDLEQVDNPVVLEDLTEAQLRFLAENGFMVMHSQEDQFYTIRESVSRVNGQPYYLTTDAAFHALHVTFDELLEALEREQLITLMSDIVEATLTESLIFLPDLEGTSLEQDAQLTIAYLSVAMRLFQPEFSVPASVQDQVDSQIQQILAAEGSERSVIFPDFQDDYGAYKPVGHYAGDPVLEQYFRGMTWLGRVHFLLSEDTRVPLLTTLALRRAQLKGRSAVEGWAEINEILNFLVGPTDDAGPLEYAVLMDRVYGKEALPTDLVDEDTWAEFQQLGDQLPAPRINSLFIESLGEMEFTVGWRFMGQRFTLDAFIFQNLVFDKVKELNGERRALPTGPDIMATFGSASALQVVEQIGATDFPEYSEQMTKLQDAVQTQPVGQWLSRAYESWLYAFFPVLQPKTQGYPSYMQTTAWGYKELNTALGSWAELKHDTILYGKMPEGAGGGGPPCLSETPPGYVEPNPEAFYRMAYVAQTIAAGLYERGLAQELEQTFWIDTSTLDGMNGSMLELGTHLKTLGDIAAKELAGLPLSHDDYAQIQRCMGASECMNRVAGFLISEMDEEIPPVPIVAAVAGAPGSILEVATGFVDRIYVVVPIEGRMQVAQGGVYSYFEFEQSRGDRLTDEAWIELLGSSQAPELPVWSAGFLLLGGSPTDSVAFYIGSAYAISEEGADLNLRASPSIDAEVLRQLDTWEYVQVIGGPVDQGGYRWWEFDVCGSGLTGWAVENSLWYWRDWR
jgi:hypothetical protein